MTAKEVNKIVLNLKKSGLKEIAVALSACEIYFNKIEQKKKKLSQRLEVLKREESLLSTHQSKLSSLELRELENTYTAKERELERPRTPPSEDSLVDILKSKLREVSEQESADRFAILADTQKSKEEKSAAISQIEDYAWSQKATLEDQHQGIINSIHNGIYFHNELSNLKLEIAGLKQQIREERASLQEIANSQKRKKRQEISNQIATAKAKYQKEAQSEIQSFQAAFNELQKIISNLQFSKINQALAVGEFQKNWLESFNLKKRLEEEGVANTRINLFSIAPPSLNIGGYSYRRIVNGFAHEIGLPILIDFHNHQNVVILYDNATKQAATSFLDSFLYRSIGAIIPGNLFLHFVDLKDGGIDFGSYRNMPSELVQIAVGDDDLRESLAHVTEQVLKENGLKIDNKSTLNIGQYNLKNVDNQASNHLFVVLEYPYGFERYSNQVENILRNGPRRGVGSVFCINKSIVEADPKKETVYRLPFQESLVFDFINNRVGERSFERIQFPEYVDGGQLVDMINMMQGMQQKKKVLFSKYKLAKQDWMQELAHSSASVPIGITENGDIQTLSFYTESDKSSALISGIPGSGKSNLLHVIITGLAIKYSPEELQVYLIDLNSGGVEFKRYVDPILPHAKVVALGSSPEFAYSIFDDIEEEFERRGQLFSEAAGEVNSLAKYNESNPIEKLPRIIIIIDEFQKLFQDEGGVLQSAYENSIDNMIDGIVREGRKYGVNLLMASQTITGALMSRSIIKNFQVKIRLGSDEDDGYTRKTEKTRNIGEGDYNANKGIPGHDVAYQTFFLDIDNQLFLSEIRKVASKISFKPISPVIFSVDNPVTISENQEYIRLKKKGGESPFIAFLGEAFNIKNRYFNFQITNDVSQNIFVCGGKTPLSSLEVIRNLIATAVTQFRKGEFALRFIGSFSNSSDEKPVKEMISRLNLGFDAEYVDSKNTVEALVYLKEEIKYRQENQTDEGFKRVFLVIANVERNARFTRESYTLSKATELFAMITSQGPLVGVHTIISCRTTDNFFRRLDRDALDRFHHRIGLQMDEDSASSFFQSSRLGRNLEEKSQVTLARYFNVFDNEHIKVKVYRDSNFENARIEDSESRGPLTVFLHHTALKPEHDEVTFVKSKSELSEEPKDESTIFSFVEDDTESSDSTITSFEEEKVNIPLNRDSTNIKLSDDIESSDKEYLLVDEVLKPTEVTSIRDDVLARLRASSMGIDFEEEE